MSSRAEIYAQNIALAEEIGAARLIEESGGRMRLMPYDPVTYPCQGPDVHFHKSENMQHGVANRVLIATAFEPGFPKIQESLQNDPNSIAGITFAGKWLAQGGDVVVVPVHDQVTDIALGQLAIKNLAEEQGFIPRSTEIILAKSFSRVEYRLGDDPDLDQYLAALKAIEMYCDLQHYVIPNSTRAKKVRSILPEDMVKKINVEILETIMKHLELGGVLLGLAASSTTEITFDENGRAKLHHSSAGTKEIMKHEKALILPIMVDAEADEPEAKIIGFPVNPTTDEGVDAVMSSLEDALNDRLAA